MHRFARVYADGLLHEDILGRRLKCTPCGRWRHARVVACTRWRHERVVACTRWRHARVVAKPADVNTEIVHGLTVSVRRLFAGFVISRIFGRHILWCRQNVDYARLHNII